jgi:O-acetyl-ADP-ribose deacetylase (regulator of RNase III)
MPFKIIRQDITKVKVDAIVNAANTDLAQGGGVCGAIFKAAGEKELQEACNKLSPIKTGQAVATLGFNLSCKYIIHAAGPRYNPNDPKESEQLLRDAYLNSLKLAVLTGCQSIAFPLISSGIYGYPVRKAYKVATSVIKKFLRTQDLVVYLVIFDKESFTISKKLQGSVESYIDDNYVEQHQNITKRLVVEQNYLLTESAGSIPTNEGIQSDDLDVIVHKLDEPFGETLFRFVKAKNKSEVEVYKHANIDRKLFSKIRTGKDYVPSKRTILALAIGLELDLHETDILLESAGYTLSHSQKFDVIVEYFIINKKYDIYELNEVLFKYDQPLLGG